MFELIVTLYLVTTMDIAPYRAANGLQVLNVGTFKTLKACKTQGRAYATPWPFYSERSKLADEATFKTLTAQPVAHFKCIKQEEER